MVRVRRIVLVDDSSEVRSALRSLLETQGFEVVGETSHHDEALDLVVDTQPDAVLLDWLFDGRPLGALVLASLGRWAPNVPVLVYTAYPEEATTQAMMLGAADVATKDIGQSARLAGLLDELIDAPRAQVRADHHEGAAADTHRARIAATAQRERARARMPMLPPADEEQE